MPNIHCFFVEGMSGQDGSRQMFAESHARLPIGRGRVNLKTLLLGWAVAEILAFALVVKLVGFGGAILLSLAASAAGFVMLRRIGFAATGRLRAVLAGGAPPDGALLDGVLEGLGALLLILPGFVSDIVGLALASSSIRQQVAGFVGVPSAPSPAGRPAPRAAPDVIDLAPSDWRVVDRADAR